VDRSSDDEQLGPAEALERVVYLLDRALAEGRRVKAYLRAAEVVREVGESEIARRHADGTLQELAGIGPSTERVIVEALEGTVHERLAALDRETAIDVAEGAELRAALRGDCHSHSTWSDGGAPIGVMARTARALGHEYLVVTDHSPRLTVAHGLSRERLERQLDEIAALNEELATDGGPPFRVLTGIEVDIHPDGTLDHRDEVLARLDVVVASVHSKLRMPEQEMTRRMVLAVANPHVDILGHCTGRKLVGAGRPPSAFDADVVFAACARFDTAVEINCRPERQDPPDELLDLALEWDCKIAIDTDAHAPGQLEWQAHGCAKAGRHGIDAERVVNTWAADELLGWAASHPSG
jgi:putative hydrolase